MTVDLDVLLDSFATRAPQVTHAVAMASDGQVLSTTSELPERCRDQLAAVGAGMIGLLDTVATVLHLGRVISNVVHMDDGFMFIIALSPQTSLLVVTSIDCDVARLGYQLSQLATWATPDPQLVGSLPEHDQRLAGCLS